MATQARPHVAVVGSGIIGSSIAHSLSQQGCRVTVLEAGERPAEGASAHSWAWLNANRKSPQHYKELNRAGMDAWRELALPAAEGAQPLAHFPGTICIGDVRDNDATYPSSQLSPEELRRMEPGLAPEVATRGGRLYAQEGVATSAGELPADMVVLAAGLGTPELAASLGASVPLADKPATFTVLTQPLPRLLSRIVVTEDAFIVQRAGGEVMISFFKAGGNPAAGGVVPGTSEASPPTRETAEQVLKRAAEVCPGLATAQLASWSAAKYPYPNDALSIAGWLPGSEGEVYAVVTHSGATLGPLLGQLAAAEVLGRPQPQLEPYRLTRDFGDQSHLY